jgi:hypothetical protein
VVIGQSNKGSRWAMERDGKSRRKLGIGSENRWLMTYEYCGGEGSRALTCVGRQETVAELKTRCSNASIKIKAMLHVLPSHPP